MRIIKNGLFASSTSQVTKTEVKIVAATRNNKNYQSKKFGRGMVKSKEDSSCSGLVTTSESILASKSCPICKTFSSASNTTLNAHIDQCLLPRVCSKPTKSRVKQRMKVKTMVEIYASAKHCTVEDLDQRNGITYTNQVVADKPEVSKKRKVLPVGVGSVYTDAKGQKLRILSEFSDKKTSSSQLKEQQEDGSKENSKCSRRIHRGKKHHKTNASEIPEYQRGFLGEGSSRSHRRIYNQRMLANRGLILTKLNEKEHKFHQTSDTDDESWSGGDPFVLSSTDSYPLNKQKLQSEVAERKMSLVGSKRAQSCSFRVQLSEKEEGSLERVHMKKRLALIQEDKYPPVRSFCVEKWKSNMTQERQLLGDDNGETNEVLLSSNSSSSGYYNCNDEDNSEEVEVNNKKTIDMAAEFYQSDTPVSVEIIPSKQAMWNVIYGQTAYEEDVRFDSEVGQGSLFVEVDSISIPGPPGSFLPSPRNMCFDENLGNSSVITSQVQSSIDQLDRNSSESPVSNFAAGRMNFLADLSVFRENLSSDITLNHQASHLMQRRADLPTGLDPNHPFEKSPCMIKQDLDIQSKFSSRPNQVLRLMGKDLMVMNQGEEVEEEATWSRPTPTLQFLEPPCAGTGIGLYLRNSLESTKESISTSIPIQKQF